MVSLSPFNCKVVFFPFSRAIWHPPLSMRLSHIYSMIHMPPCTQNRACGSVSDSMSRADGGKVLERPRLRICFTLVLWPWSQRKQNSSLLISCLPVMIRILKEELWSYECMSLKCQQNAWLILYFVDIRLVQSSNIFLLIISDNLFFFFFFEVTDWRWREDVSMNREIPCSQNLKSLLDKWNTIVTSIGGECCRRLEIFLGMVGITG